MAEPADAVDIIMRSANRMKVQRETAKQAAKDYAAEVEDARVKAQREEAATE